MHLGELAVYPLFLPGVAVSIAVSLAAGGRLCRALGVGQVVAWTLILSLGVILSATLTPFRGALEHGVVGMGPCDLSRVGLPPLRELLAVTDTSLNVLMFGPLGVAVAFIPRSRHAAVVALAAIALPFAIEATQALVPWLDRTCESADVVDNLTGLMLGLAAGSVASRIARRADRRRE